MIKKLLIYIGFLFPAAFSSILNYLITEIFIPEKLYSDILIATILFAFCLLFKPGKLRAAVTIIMLLFIYAITFIEVGHIYLYKGTLTASTLFIIFDTNPAEVKEFLQMYFDRNLIIMLVSMAVMYIFCVYHIVTNKNYWLNKWIKVVYILVIISMSYYVYKLRENSLPYTIFKAYSEYKIEIAKYNQFEFSKNGGKFSKVTSKINNKQVYVLVIGESATKTHMGLYNYYRQTTPLLKKLEDNLVVYNNVITPHTHTITALEKVLTVANYENPKKQFDGSVIQLFNRAGFKTYWISNQRPAGFYDTFVTALSKSSDKRFFINTAHNSYQTPFDEQLFIPLQKCLDETADKKLIIVHLLGSHADYSQRFPKSYQKFITIPQTQFKNTAAYSTINQYDNSILYTDYIVSEVIDKIKKQNCNSFVMYLSDHGEDVYQTTNTAYHTETKGTKPMYQIPFILWQSDKQKEATKNLVFYPERKYMSDDLIYTMADLAIITFVEFDPSRSLVNKNFNKNRKRQIYNKNNFDVIFQ